MMEKKSSKHGSDRDERPLGWFLEDVASGRAPRAMPAARTESPEEYARNIDSTARKFYAAKRNDWLKGELDSLKSTVAALKRGKNLNGRCPLWRYVRDVKETYPSKARDQAFIARKVDERLERDGKELRNVCPDRWKKNKNLPRLLSDARNVPGLKIAAKVLVAQVKVS
jgi:hypothetical protein